MNKESIANENRFLKLFGATAKIRKIKALNELKLAHENFNRLTNQATKQKSDMELISSARKEMGISATVSKISDVRELKRKLTFWSNCLVIENRCVQNISQVHKDIESSKSEIIKLSNEFQKSIIRCDEHLSKTLSYYARIRASNEAISAVDIEERYYGSI